MAHALYMLCWITKATDTHSEYVIHIVLQLHKWLRERTTALRYALTAYLVDYYTVRI
jgi:hypothetical protein